MSTNYQSPWVLGYGGSSNPWSLSNPRSEARELLNLIRAGTMTIEEVRTMIEISARDERNLIRNFCPNAIALERYRNYRAEVLHEFNLLVAGKSFPTVHRPAPQHSEFTRQTYEDIQRQHVAAAAARAGWRKQFRSIPRALKAIRGTAP